MDKPRTRRPWTVFVHDIGPTFTFATEERARSRAEALAAGQHDGTHYGHVDVYKAYEPGDGGEAFPMFRTVYSSEHAPCDEVLTSEALHRSISDRRYGWQPVDERTEQERRFIATGEWVDTDPDADFDAELAAQPRFS